MILINYSGLSTLTKLTYMTNKEIYQRINDLGAIQNITDVYQQVAAIRMRKIKDTVVQNRNFYESLSKVYMETRRFYIDRIARGGKYAPKYLGKTNGKSVAVLISANTGLYGGVTRNVFDLFIKDQLNSNDDLVITGRLGRNWAQSAKLERPFKYFDLNDGTEGIENGIKKIFDYLSNYANISVYHGKFNNIVEQPAVISKITQRLDVQDEGEEPHFLFEPTIEKVLERFEEELVYSFFDQSIYEANLAKFVSRMINLDTATQRVSKALDNMRISASKAKHKRQNKRQSELFSNITLWN